MDRQKATIVSKLLSTWESIESEIDLIEELMENNQIEEVRGMYMLNYLNAELADVKDKMERL